MTGKEALRIYHQLGDIYTFLVEGEDRQAFYYLGILTEQLSQIVRIDQVSFNPTVSKDEPI